jgi:hypothetical protein
MDKRAGSRLFVTIFSFLFSLLFTFNASVLEVDSVIADNGTVYPDSISHNTGTDCTFEKGPTLIAPPDKYVAATDNSVDRNGLIKLAWNQLCSATKYELQISEDAGFTRFVTWAINKEPVRIDSGTIVLDMGPDEDVNPSAYVRESALRESGINYWWRVRATKLIYGQVERSPWSDTRCFMIKSVNFIVGPPNDTVWLFSPLKVSMNWKVNNMSFSWSARKEVTQFQLDLAKDPRFKDIIVTAITDNYTYTYDGKLDYRTEYFWRVAALEINHERIPPDWSATSSFFTEQPPPSPSLVPPTPVNYTWLWIIAAISALLAIVIVVLVMLRRKTPRR